MNPITDTKPKSKTRSGSPSRGFDVKALLLVALTVAVHGPAAGQPALTDANWFSLNPSISGADGEVASAVVDSSGNLYICGAFNAVGGVVNNGVAKWDGTSWSTLGSGLNGGVYALAAQGNEVYAAGQFTTAGGLAATNIAKWDGTNWSAVGTGLGVTDPYSFVTAVAASGAKVYAAVGSGAPNAQDYMVYQWDGSTWTALGAGLDGGVDVLAASGNDLYAGGGFIAILGGPVVFRIAHWDGNSWSGMGSASPPNGSAGTGVNNAVFGLLISGSDVYVAGSFSLAGGAPANGIAKWDGANWSALGSGVNGAVSSFAMLGGDLYVAGGFTTAGGVPANYVARWDGSNWSAVGAGVDEPVLALGLSSGNLFAVKGDLNTFGELEAGQVARWDGSNWNSSSTSAGWGGNPPRTPEVSSVAATAKRLYVSGAFTISQPGGGQIVGLAQGDGTNWTSLGSGLDGGASALAASGNNLFVGGSFTTAGGVQASNIAQWDGSTWTALGSGLNGGVSALAMSGGNLYVGGVFTTSGGAAATNIAVWDGSNWSALGGGLNGSVGPLAASGSNVYAGLTFTPPRGPPPWGGPPPPPVHQILQWDGNTWTQLGTVNGGSTIDNPFISSFAVLGGDLYVSGFFGEVDTETASVQALSVAKWDGTNWTALGSGIVGGPASSLAGFGDKLFVGGQFMTAGGIAANNIARWDGTSWTALGSGTGGQFSSVHALSLFGSDLYAVGDFTVVGGKVSGYVARASLVPPSPGSQPAASFSADPSSGQAPLRVQFTDHSTGGIDSWLWDFGDGSRTTAQPYPVHTFAHPGEYITTLTVAGDGGSSTNTMLISVTPRKVHRTKPDQPQDVAD